MISRRDLWLALAVQMSWGLHTPLIKMAVEQAPPFTLLTMRFLLTALLFLPFMRRPDRETWIRLVRAGVIVFGLAFALIFLALERMDASTYVVLFQMQIPMGVLAGAVFFGEKISARTWAGVALATAGVVVMFGEPKVHQDFLAVLLVFLACLSGVANGVIMKKMGNIHLPTFICVTALIAALIEGVLAFVLERGQWPRLAEADGVVIGGVLLYQALGMSLAMMAWQRILSRNALSLVNPLNLLFPFFSVLFSLLILNERLTWPIVMGGALILAGVAAVVWKERRKEPIIDSVNNNLVKMAV